MHSTITTRLLAEGHLMLWVTPGARKAEIVGFVQGPHDKEYLKLKVQAPPEDGRANKAVLDLLTQATGLSLTLASGTTSRFKRLTLA